MTSPRALTWNQPWVSEDFPCPHCGLAVTTPGHTAVKQDCFGHDLDIVTCPRLLRWYLVWAPDDRP